MLFFRSEERAREWCTAQHFPLRPLVRMDQLWVLADAWYSARLQPDSRRPQPAEMREIFNRIGLLDAFWNPEADSFGPASTK